jgi:hypothetical protein
VKAFGREVAVKVVVAVLAAVIIAALTAIGGAIKYLAPSIAAYYQLTVRESLAWATVVALFVVVIVMSLYLASLQRRKASSFALMPNSGVKPSVTLTNHGDPTTYRVDGRILNVVDGMSNPHPASFRCELQVGGITGAWDAPLANGEWAHIILGSLEPVFPKSGVLSATESWTPVGHTLVIRRGKQGQHVQVPDGGAVVELTVLPTPQPPKPAEPKQFRVIRDGNTVNVFPM